MRFFLEQPSYTILSAICFKQGNFVFTYFNRSTFFYVVITYTERTVPLEVYLETYDVNKYYE